MKHLKLTILLLVAVLAISACVPIQPEAAANMPMQESTGAMAYTEHGPYAVGYMPLSIDDGNGDPLSASVWYPAVNESGQEEAVTYDLVVKTPEMFGSGEAVVYGKALLNAPADAASAPYPLVVFSHGFGLNAAAYHELVEHMASYGFVVLAPEHIEGDWFESMMAVIDRPNDIKRTLDYAELLTAEGGALAGMIDMDNVAAVGHSYGGYTTLAVGGALMDLNAFEQRCSELAEDSPEQFLCAPIVGQETAMAEYAGLADVPEGLWPSSGDSRVKAIVPIAGDAFLFDTDGLASITVPMMAIGGTADTGTPYDWGSKLSYDYTSSAEKSLVGLVGAEHMVAGSSCDDMPWTADSPYAPFICQDPAWDKADAHDVIQHYATAFLLATLEDDAEARTELLPDAAKFENVEYTTTFQ